MDTGKLAYDSYCQAAGGRSLVSGASLPSWDDLPLPIRAAWVASAEAVYDYARDQER